MIEIYKIKKLGLWIFILPFISINICLILAQIFTFREFDVPSPGNYFFDWKIFNIGDAIGDKGSKWIIPYFDGVSSISRVARVFPNTLIFKPAMFITGILLIIYWTLNKKLILNLSLIQNDVKKMYYFGISSAIFLIIHSIFLGIKFDYSIYKLFRRIILLLFIFFEITAQFYLIKIFYINKNALQKLINTKILIIKKILVYILIFTAIIILPFLPFNNLKILKHILEWNYFLGVILFYLLTFFLWKKNVKL
tara:strand:- start:159 stop:914 length:756 start_codon:yes stop_codon:yes gene_type:complete